MTGQSDQIERVERRLRQMYADAAAAPTEIDGTTAADVITRGRARRRRTRMTAAGVAAAIAVLAAAGISVVPRLLDQSVQPAWKPIGGDGRVPSDLVGVWVDSLPSGPVAQAAWVDGDMLHVGAHTVRITGHGITPSRPITMHAATDRGWFVSVEGPPKGRLWSPSRFGLIHLDGTFVEFQKYPVDVPVLISPDGSQALIGADSGGEIISTATGQIIMREPDDMSATAWTTAGIYAGEGYPHQRPVVWKPGVGITKSPFDGRHCQSTVQTMASVRAGYTDCTIPRLVSVSPDGKKALAGNHLLDLATGRSIKFAASGVFGWDFANGGYDGGSREHEVVWEDDQHVLILLSTPTLPRGAVPTNRLLQFSSDIIRCNFVNGSCERASDLITSGDGLVPLR